MTEQELDDVKGAIECESFEYTFIHYSDFLEIEDEEFQKLRKEYVEAYKRLAAYLEVDV